MKSKLYSKFLKKDNFPRFLPPHFQEVMYIRLRNTLIMFFLRQSMVLIKTSFLSARLYITFECRHIYCIMAAGVISLRWFILMQIRASVLHLAANPLHFYRLYICRAYIHISMYLPSQSINPPFFSFSIFSC